jgi:hypothetical protein
MRLFEKVVAARPMIVSRRTDGTRLRLAGVGAKRSVLEACPVRYVLDDDASLRCLSEVTNTKRSFDPSNPLLRIPAPVMWLEMRGGLDGLAANSVGFLIESDSSGRAGIISTYLAGDGKPAKIVVMRTVFDLDVPIGMRNLPLMTSRLKHAEFRQLDPLFHHMVGEVDESWRQVIAEKNSIERQAELARLAQACWFALPAALIFTEMLDACALRTSQMHKASSGRSRALELRAETIPSHVEVTLTLEPDQACHDGAEHGLRLASRPHHVRGHLVNRGGKVFWRSSHSRCASAGDAIPKVVTVRQQRRSRLGR